MKRIIYFGVLVIICIAFSKCEQEYDDLVTENAEIGGLADLSTTSVNYVVGEGASYGFDVFLYQNEGSQANTVNFYKSVVKVPVPWSNPDDTTHTTPDSIPSKISNEILEESISVTETGNTKVSMTPLDYDGLKTGLQIDGADLPATDGEMRIGDYFNFRVEVVLANGKTVQQAKPVKMTVSTRFAGKYLVKDLVYYRLGVLSPSYWINEYVLIQSVDAITYYYDWGASIGWTGPLYFQIDANGNITYPEEWNGVAQVLNDEALITLDRNPTDLTSVANYFANPNVAIKDDVNGRDQLPLVYGYYTAGSGPREFAELLEKVVE